MGAGDTNDNFDYVCLPRCDPGLNGGGDVLSGGEM
jgi:hypothetical protein